MSCDYDDARSVLSASTNCKFNPTGMFKDNPDYNENNFFDRPKLKISQGGHMSTRFSQIDFEKQIKDLNEAKKIASLYPN